MAANKDSSFALYVTLISCPVPCFGCLPHGGAVVALSGYWQLVNNICHHHHHQQQQQHHDQQQQQQQQQHYHCHHHGITVYYMD